MKRSALLIGVVLVLAVVLLVFRTEITGKLGYISQGVFVCEDSDNTIVKGGRIDDYSHVVKGAVTTSKTGGERSASKEDSCVGVGKRHVSEYYCTESNEAGLIREIECETGVCDNGACVGCYDSDEGIKILNKGVAYYSDSINYEVGYDECVLGFTNMVKEYSCESGKLVSEEIECPPQTTCQDGMCRA